MKTIEIAPHVHTIPGRGVNVYFIESGKTWGLIDAGWPGDFAEILSAAEECFGDKKPCALYLTHAHPDHIGAARKLALHWNVPVFMHDAEVPVARSDFSYIAKYPIPMDKYIILPILGLLGEKTLRTIAERESLGNSARALPNGTGFMDLPDLSGWKFLSTPGHTVGHIIFFRETDRVLISGDALLTAACGGLFRFWRTVTLPLRMASWNWAKTKSSAKMLAKLQPRVLATGHGPVLAGDELKKLLARFLKKL